MPSARKVFTPDPSMLAHYERRYQLFLDLTDAMGGFWTTQQKLTQKD
jgi:hypothetical protein